MSEFFETREEQASEQARNEHFQTLLKAAQAGSQEAARELHDTYVQHVLRCVRHKMWRRLRTRFDSTDFVQQVWASFFLEGNRLPDFDTPGDLLNFLQTLAARKVLLEGRRQHNQKADVELEMRIDDQASHILGPHPAAHDPTPSAIAAYREQYDRLVEQQMPEVREVAEMRVEGSTFAEIAESLGIDESTARRFIRRIRRRSQQDE